MPRIRAIKPEFFTDADLCELPPLHRLLFAGLWCQADREGRLEDKPKELKIKILPYDACDVDAMLTVLSNAKDGHGFVVRYEVDGRPLIQCRRFLAHQRPHKDEKTSILPPLPNSGAKPAEAPLKPNCSDGGALEARVKTPVACSLLPVSGSLLPVFAESTSSPAKSKKTQKAKPPPDPRHRPMVDALVLAAPGYVFDGGKDAKAVTSLLAKGSDEEILLRWARARSRTGYPLTRSLSELVTHWNHFADTGPPKPVYVPAKQKTIEELYPVQPPAKANQ